MKMLMFFQNVLLAATTLYLLKGEGFSCLTDRFLIVSPPLPWSGSSFCLAFFPFFVRVAFSPFLATLALKTGTLHHPK